ncbi:hypothetical protein EON65_34175 [archaeon]|nr:MAG: hypothetical protein EON65_34175 [archaeon]
MESQEVSIKGIYNLGRCLYCSMNEGEEDYNDAMDYIVTDEFGKSQLKQDKPQRQHERRNEEPHPLEWVKYAVYIWAIRLSLSTLGSLMPVAMGYLSIFTLGGFFGPAVQSSNSLFVMYNISSLDWQTMQRPGELASVLRDSILPIKLVNIPTIRSSTSKILLRSLYLSHVLRLKVQYNDRRYVYFDEHRLWSNMFCSIRTYSYQSLSSYLTASIPDASVSSCSSFDDQNICSSSEYKVSYPAYEYFDFMRDTIGGGGGGEESDKNKQNEQNTKPNSIVKASNPSGKAYVYSSYSDLLPYLEVFAPQLVGALAAAYVHINSAQLWLSTEGVQAGFHYDIQDNILYQLSGEKTVYVLVHPNHSSIHTYPSFHPYYRQSFMVHGDATLSHVYGESIERETGSVLQVVLRKGEAIYIPKGYLHSVVTSSPDSLSLNTWLHSQAYADWASKLEGITLPFRFVGTKTGRLARVGAIAREVSRVLYGHDLVFGGDENDISHGLARELQIRMKGPVIEHELLEGHQKAGSDNKHYELMCTEQDNISAGKNEASCLLYEYI